MKHTKGDLQQMQSLPLSAKIQMTKRRIRDWYDFFDGQVYVSFSGGKDSTVLLHIARKLYPDIEAVFVNTGLEYPEIQQFVKTFDNVTILRPKMRFDEVIKTYGYPVISKAVANAIDTYQTKVRNGKPLTGARIEQLLGIYEGNRNDGKKSKFDKSKYKPLLNLDCKISDRCCGIMKKAPLKAWEKQNKKYPIVATMAEESIMREAAWLKTGCNGFDMKRPMSKPMSFWTEQDVYQFIPNVSSLEIVKMFSDADSFTLEGLKLVPQNKEHKDYLLKLTGLTAQDFTQMGLLNLKPENRLKMYEPFIEYFKKHNIPYSIADNDLRRLSTNKCCCGDRLVNKATSFNSTAMIMKYGEDYAKEQIDEEIFCCGVRDCKCNQLFTSNRQEGCVTVQEFYDKRFYRKSSPFSPQFQYGKGEKQVDIFDLLEVSGNA